MTPGLQVFFSHRVESLYDKMRSRLFSAGSHPFARRLVIVPSPAMKSWLYLTMAKDPSCGIAAGLDVGYVDQTMQKLMQAADLQRLSGIELSVLIEKHLSVALAEGDSLWDPVKEFIGSPLSARKAQKRLNALSLQLAKLFEGYGTYGGSLPEEWERKPAGWQEALWKLVWHDATEKTYPIRQVADALSKDVQPLIDRHVEVHLFSISFLPALYHNLLKSLSDRLSINYYVLSPCQAFWSDIKSDSEGRRLYNFWKTRGASDAQLTALDNFLRDRNPLLANFGRLGREMAEQIEKADFVTEEEFFVPVPLAAMQPYEELLSHDVVLNTLDRPVSMLDCIQADLTLLRNPLESGKIPLSRGDRSIQLHASPTRRREVQVLYDVLMGIMDKHKEDADPITPGDIIVMAPDLTVYEPYVKVAFGSKNGPLDYQLMEVELLSHSSFVQAFMSLIDLAAGRWDAAALIEIFELPYVKTKHRFSSDEVRKFRQWIKEAGIRWGESPAHCNEILKRESCSSPLVDEKQPGTWEGGIDRLIAGLAFTSADRQQTLPCAPIEVVASSEGELLGRWIEFLKALKADIKPMQDGSLLPMEQWTEYLKAVMDAYLAVEPADKEEAEHREELIQELDKLGRSANATEGHRFPFQSVKAYVEKILQAKRVNYREGYLKAVRFCSMLPMRALPAKVVVLMGMEDSAFPKRDIGSGLDLLAGAPEADYSPAQGDFDRSLFLEAILSARRYLIMSYTGYEGGRKEPASVLVTELMTYLDEACETEGEKPSEMLSFAHPLHAFDEACFKKDAPFSSYSLRAYQAARAHYRAEKADPHLFLPTFAHPKDVLARKHAEPRMCSVDIKDLSRLSKNPLKAYFNKTLGIYVNEVSNRHVEVDELFDLNSLQMYKLKEKSLTGDSAAVIGQAEKEGSLPAGLFRDVVEQKFEKEAAKIAENLLKLGAAEKDVFTIFLAEGYKEPINGASGWKCPPLHITTEDGACYKIVGTLEYVTSEGILAFKSASLKEVAQVWPQFLILTALVDQYKLPIKKQLLLLKDGNIPAFDQIDLKHALQQFLAYYTDSVAAVSPLVPEWLDSIVKADADGLKKEIKSNLGIQENFFFNQYVKWAFHDDGGIPNTEEIVAQWADIAQDIYGPLASVFEKKKKGDE